MPLKVPFRSREEVPRDPPPTAAERQGTRGRLDRAARPRRFRLLLLTVLLLLALAAAIPSSRNFFLRIPGRALVVPTPAIQSSDIIVLGVDARGAGTLEVADLVHQGVSSRVAVFEDPPTVVDREFLRRGVPYYDAAAVSIRQLEQLGVRRIEVIPRAVSGSEDEGRLLPQWCDLNHFESVVLVVNADHGRRLQRILRRAMKGHPTKVILYPTPYSGFVADSWWKTRTGAREGIMEFEKLLLDFMRHPLS